MFMSGNSSGYEHFTKAFHSKSDEGFENPYTSDHELLIRNHPMTVMADYSRRVSQYSLIKSNIDFFTQTLLRHPLCLSLVREKWIKFGKMSYFLLFTLYLLFLASLTTYILTSINPVDHPQFYNCSEYFANKTQGPVLPVNGTLPEEPYKNLNHFCRISCILLCVFYLILSLLEDSWLILAKVTCHLENSLKYRYSKQTDIEKTVLSENVRLIYNLELLASLILNGST